MTILNKRENYRRAFDGFDPDIVAAYDESKVAELLADPGIVRNRQKITAAIGNARAFGPVREEFDSFAAYLTYKKHGSQRESHPLFDRPEIDWPCRT